MTNLVEIKHTSEQRANSIVDALTAKDITSDDVKIALTMIDLRHLSILSNYCTEILYHRLDEIFNHSHHEA